MFFGDYQSDIIECKINFIKNNLVCLDTSTYNNLACPREFNSVGRDNARYMQRPMFKPCHHKKKEKNTPV